MTAVPIRRAALAGSALLVLASVARAAEAPGDPGRYTAMLARPLFSPTRRPPPPAPAVLPPLEAPTAPVLDLALSGVIAGGGGGVALLRRAQDPAPIRVALGGQVDGWTVAEIRPRAVVLRRAARSVTVELPATPR